MTQEDSVRELKIRTLVLSIMNGTDEDAKNQLEKTVNRLAECSAKQAVKGQQIKSEPGSAGFVLVRK